MTLNAPPFASSVTVADYAVNTQTVANPGDSTGSGNTSCHQGSLIIYNVYTDPSLTTLSWVTLSISGDTSTYTLTISP